MAIEELKGVTVDLDGAPGMGLDEIGEVVPEVLGTGLIGQRSK